MKILMVEEYDTHRILTTDILKDERHQVHSYLPAESLFASYSELPTFKDPQELTDILMKQEFDAAILNRSAFRTPKISSHYDAGLVLREYVEKVLESRYTGKIVVTTAPPITILEEQLGKCYAKITPLEKPFGERELKRALNPDAL